MRIGCHGRIQNSLSVSVKNTAAHICVFMVAFQQELSTIMIVRVEDDESDRLDFVTAYSISASLELSCG